MDKFQVIIKTYFNALAYSASISTSDQRCGSTLKQRWFDVENETKFEVGFSTFHNVDTM